ncbi:hypothetical protein K7432_001766 [Basidiobolus ranarum]|uniref:PHD-type domain-containing protein n=1 Tax=Basidiobolus ranarum TaxID=34480 RepID=A0ABR2W9A3_9FUNG
MLNRKTRRTKNSEGLNHLDFQQARQLEAWKSTVPNYEEPTTKSGRRIRQTIHYSPTDFSVSKSKRCSKKTKRKVDYGDDKNKSVTKRRKSNKSKVDHSTESSDSLDNGNITNVGNTPQESTGSKFICNSCQNGNLIESELLLICDQCHQPFHRACYAQPHGVTKDMKDSWTCDNCTTTLTTVGKDLDSIKQVHCVESRNNYELYAPFNRIYNDLHESCQCNLGDPKPIDSSSNTRIPLKVKMEINGVGLTFAQKEDYFKSLTHDQLIQLLMVCEVNNTEFSFFPVRKLENSSIITQSEVESYIKATRVEVEIPYRKELNTQKTLSNEPEYLILSNTPESSETEGSMAIRLKGDKEDGSGIVECVTENVHTGMITNVETEETSTEARSLDLLKIDQIKNTIQDKTKDEMNLGQESGNDNAPYSDTIAVEPCAEINARSNLIEGELDKITTLNEAQSAMHSDEGDRENNLCLPKDSSNSVTDIEMTFLKYPTVLDDHTKTEEDLTIEPVTIFQRNEDSNDHAYQLSSMIQPTGTNIEPPNNASDIIQVSTHSNEVNVPQRQTSVEDSMTVEENIDEPVTSYQGEKDMDTKEL